MTPVNPTVVELRSRASEDVRPAVPRTLEEAGLSAGLMTPLVLKTIYAAGELTGAELARRLGVQFSVIEPCLETLKAQRHFTVGGGSMVGGPTYRYGLTAEGAAAAVQAQQHDRYLGCAPVPIAQYRDYLKTFERLTLAKVDRTTSAAELRSAFSQLVLSDRVLDQIGPAFRSGRSMFIFGAPGNGKTAIAQAVHVLLPGDIAIPHAIEIDGNIIRVFDPAVHRPRPIADRPERVLSRAAEADERWVTCRRPVVVAGGELTLDAMDVAYVPGAGYYRAPLQLLANGGLLIIDDFGRQRCSPSDLLNRWMHPLESGTDFLTLQSGLRFEVPFLALVVFTTNLNPWDLVDEAFMRRVQYKVAVEDPTEEDFIRIFEDECRRTDLPFERAVIEQLIEQSYRPQGLPLRSCQPRDLTAHALLLAEHRGQPRRLTFELLRDVVANYFVVNPTRGRAAGRL